MLKKCRYYYKKRKNHCNKEAFASVRVSLIHTDTGRKSKQTWQLCGKHFELFMDMQGKDWEVTYQAKPNKRALLIGFQVLDGLEYGYRN